MGAKLLKEISEGTGLPQDMVTYELDKLLKQAGLKKEQVTLDEIRDVLANYLQDVLVEAKHTLR